MQENVNKCESDTHSHLHTHKQSFCGFYLTRVVDTVLRVCMGRERGRGVERAEVAGPGHFSQQEVKLFQ